MTPTDPPASDLTPLIGKVALRQLALNGFASYEDLTRAPARTLLGIHGVGPKAIRILGDELAARGLAFRSEGEDPRSRRT